MQHVSARRHAIAAIVALLVAISAAPATAGPTVAERVRLPFPAYDGTLTPYTFELGYPLVTLVYDTLLWRDAAGVPKPWLARSVTRSDDGLRLTVQLRDGVRWHDGRPLTAADVAFTLRYVASHYQPRFTPQLADVRRVRATGRLTAQIELRRPSLGFDDQPLADLPILPRHLWRGLGPGRVAPRGLPVGSGPYRLASSRAGAGIRPARQRRLLPRAAASTRDPRADHRRRRPHLCRAAPAARRHGAAEPARAGGVGCRLDARRRGPPRTLVFGHRARAERPPRAV